MAWTWDIRKALANKRKHGLGFDVAQRVFDDPLALSKLDPGHGEERWLTIGAVSGVVIIVAHTWPDEQAGNVPGRIISARKATSRERKAYEEDIP